MPLGDPPIPPDYPKVVHLSDRRPEITFEADFDVVTSEDATPTAEQEFIAHLHNFSHMAMLIARNKNVDYAGNGDPFANFRGSEALGVSLPRGILVRISDKMARISNLISRPPAVANESLIDTCLDASNYFLILATYFRMHPEGNDGGDMG